MFPLSFFFDTMFLTHSSFLLILCSLFKNIISGNILWVFSFPQMAHLILQLRLYIIMQEYSYGDFQEKEKKQDNSNIIIEKQ